MSIPVFVINLKEREDRLSNIHREFENRSEFDVQVIPAFREENGALGLWKTMVTIIQIASQKNHEYVVICEDDHQFTVNYHPEVLNQCILEASQRSADILLGGVSWFENALQVSPELFWLDRFTGLQFTVVFRTFYTAILEARFEDMDAADLKISAMTANKMVIWPFISTQKEFGYSDVTARNNERGYVDRVFSTTAVMLEQLATVKAFYWRSPLVPVDKGEYEEMRIPTYLLNLKAQPEHLAQLEKEFQQHKEFDLTVVAPCLRKDGAVDLWNSILKVVRIAVENEDEVIVLCEAEHEFTREYSWNVFLQHILDGNECGADLLIGGLKEFGQAIPVSSGLYWLDHFCSTSFMVLYQRVFNKILEEGLDDELSADEMLSQITSHKMVLYPFISVQKEAELFNQAAKRIERIENAYINQRF